MVTSDDNVLYDSKGNVICQTPPQYPSRWFDDTACTSEGWWPTSEVSTTNSPYRTQKRDLENVFQVEVSNISHSYLTAPAPSKDTYKSLVDQYEMGEIDLDEFEVKMKDISLPPEPHTQGEQSSWWWLLVPIAVISAIVWYVVLF